MEDNHIADQRVRGFVGALRKFEQDQDPSTLVGLFADAAVLTRLDGRGEREDAEGFWRQYREQFHDLSTTFFNVVEGSDQFALEWTSKGTLANDRPLTYSGVTVLDFADEQIVQLRTYYDTAAFTTPSATTG